MARKPTNAEDDKMINNGQGKALPETLAAGDTAPSVKDLPPANPLGEPVLPVEEYPNISEAGKQAAALGVETSETVDLGKAVGGETIVEHPVSPTDANPNPHGQRDEGFVSVATKGKDGETIVSKPDDGDTEVTGTSDNPVHLGDGRTLANGAKAKVSKEVAKDLRDRGLVK